MSIVKRLTALGLAAAMAISVAGCGGGSHNADGELFYFSHDKNDGIPGAIYTSLEEAAKADSHDVQFMNPSNNPNVQIDQVNEAIDKGAGAIVLLAVDGDSIIPAVKRANEAGIPVIATNRDVRGGVFNNVVNDEKQAGRLQGEYMAAHLPQGANIVYLSGDVTIGCAVDRWEGFKEACLDKRPDLHLLVKSVSGDWSNAYGIKNMALWLKLFPKIDAVVAGNDNEALGAMQALKSTGRLEGVLISGIDATPPVLKAIEAGEMAQTIKQDTKNIGETIYDLIKQYRAGKTQTDEVIMVPLISVTKDNIAQYK